MSTVRASKWAPANETQADILSERENLNGAVLGGVGYGVHVTLFFISLDLLMKQLKTHPRRSYCMLAYIFMLFTLGSLGNAANIKFNEMVFVDNRDYPGGPNAYFIEQNGVWINVLSYGVYIVNTWLQDGLLLYRFHLIWNSNIWLTAIPGLFYTVSVVMSCLLLSQIAEPGDNIWKQLSVKFALTYWCISIGATLLLTTLIVVRLLYMRYKLRKVMGPHHRSPYLSISTILVESAFLYCAVGLAFIITYARNDPAQNIFLPVLGQVQSIAPLLIIMRTCQGRAWTKDTAKMVTTTGDTFASDSTKVVPMTPLRFHGRRGHELQAATHWSDPAADGSMEDTVENGLGPSESLPSFVINAEKGTL
ncbi:hypothetical protein PUNSTDRAFT_76804 [Punctularia strigosozonata HHB-11173 SS5]|uniref:Uncharacterized protein n=1 Tax=Punctularia strigosozonata (strain HHB-11173) TaxID=741275 RepID=R7S177_PUNST|nr:uncharacterized protein PUNSTDRAFT_76804 [Punctularia strigosozonata HHB-11173 SS5]EIN04130.1 hypothetical protein PUNSTDRAFT_76804 [Punctularia strigosozonata HHB-11173 SS5]